MLAGLNRQTPTEDPMQLWILVLGLLASQGPWTNPDVDPDLNMSDPDPVRYRGIEQLLAKFEAEQDERD
jgi:hypothetical protein